MTATPIPRTLAMTMYGDLDVSVIDEMPPGRKPIVTKHSTSDHIEKVYSFMKAQIDEGRQAYVVYPVIEESETQAMKAAQKEYEHLSREVFPEIAVGLMHGRLGADEKEAVMQRFKDGQIKILVSTTVIEVGVDVPNASVMVVEQAERFGLAQLHQLRGRVGRGAAQSYCLLVTEKMNDTARERIRTLVESTDGFYISEMDLKLRGPGRILRDQAIRAAEPAHRQHSARYGNPGGRAARRGGFHRAAARGRRPAARGGVHTRSLAAPLRPGDGGLMRIIAGEFRSRRLESIPGDATRPTPDRVREALFNILQTRIEGASFVDAYAGTGAVGIEALSRGAAHAWFLERDRRALDAIRKNLASLGVERRATVLAGKVLVTLERCPARDRVPGSAVRPGGRIHGRAGVAGRAAAGADDRAALGAPEAEGCVRRAASDADGEARG